MKKNPTTFEIYRSYDDVIRAHVPPREAGRYASLRDVTILREAGLPEDAQPVLFLCRALRRSQREQIELILNDKARYRAAFRMSLLEVRNLVDDDGRPASPSSWKPSRGGPDDPLNDDALDDLEDLGFGDRDVWEIGSAIEGLSQVGKGGKPSCPLLDSSRRVWATPNSSPRAEPSQDDETPLES